MRQRIAANLWHEEDLVFTNRFPNGSFYPRRSPTSFYALLANAATDEQAEAMVEHWLLNSTRFCVSLDWPNGNTDECFWGLPSISADDDAFPQLGYCKYIISLAGIWLLVDRRLATRLSFVC